MERKRLTDNAIERMTPPTAGRREIADALLPALALRVTERGTKSWSVCFRIAGRGGAAPNGRPLAGKTLRVTLGKWPVLLVADARKRAREILAGAAEGRDARQERRDAFAHRQETAVERVAEHFLQEEQRRIPSWRNGELALRRHVLPTWTGRPIGDVSRADVHALLDALVASGKIGAAREVRKTLSKLFGFALDRDLVLRSPVERIRRDDLKPNKDAGRALSDAELRAAWLAASEMGYAFGDAFRLLLLSGARLGEVARATWPEVDFAERTLMVSPERHKSRRGQLIPLSEPAWRIVTSLPRFRRGDFMFTNTFGRSPISGFTRASDALRDAAATVLRRNAGLELPHFRVHDLRVTVRTRLTELRVAPHVAEAVLGHARVGLERIYDKSELAAEKRGALELWAKALMEIVGDG